jgi:hypothetical protein
VCVCVCVCVLPSGFSEFKEGFGYLEERLSRTLNPAAPHQQRFERAIDRWSVLDVARWLEEAAGVGQVRPPYPTFCCSR